MGDQTADIKEEIKKTERRLELLRDIDILDAEYRLIKTEYLQRRRELCLRLSEGDLETDRPAELVAAD